MIKIAIIGCGAVVEELYCLPLRRLQSKNWIKVVALIDTSPARAQKIGHFFPGARFFSSTEEAFCQLAVDLTIITSPPGWHSTHACAALSHGSHVLCEKPLANQSIEGQAMIQASKKAQRLLAVGMTRRFYPVIPKIRDLIFQGTLGEDLQMTYREGSVYAWPIASDAAFKRASAGGGVLMDKGSHVVDYLMALGGELKVAAFWDDALTNGVEANALIELQVGPLRGKVQLSWDQPLYNGLWIKGSKGELFWNLDWLDRLEWRNHGKNWEVLSSNHGWPKDLDQTNPQLDKPRSYNDCIYYQIVQILRSIAHQEPVPVDGAQALIVIKSLEECYKMAQPLHLPWLETGEQELLLQHHWKKS